MVSKRNWKLSSKWSLCHCVPCLICAVCLHFLIMFNENKLLLR